MAGKINTETIGVMGHSYGAYTTLAVCGAQPVLDHLEPEVSPGTGLAGDLSDPRVSFGLAMSPQPPGSAFFSEESYHTINRPLVGITGSNDNGTYFDGKLMPAVEKWKFWQLLPPGDKYFIWMENATHLSFVDNPTVRMIPSRLRRDVQRITKKMMVLFADYYLKGEKEDADKMNQEYANSLCGNSVTEIQWNEK